jgi:hypothetical protein
MSETCRVSFQNTLEKLVHLVGFIIRKFVTMHGHMNVKKMDHKFDVLRFSESRLQDQDSERAVCVD